MASEPNRTSRDTAHIAGHAGLVQARVDDPDPRCTHARAGLRADRGRANAHVAGATNVDDSGTAGFTIASSTASSVASVSSGGSSAVVAGTGDDATMSITTAIITIIELVLPDRRDRLLKTDPFFT